MLHFPTWWLIWLVVLMVFAVARGVFARKASATRERERQERAEQQRQAGRRHIGAARQRSTRADGQALVTTRDQLIAAGVIIPATEPDSVPPSTIA